MLTVPIALPNGLTAEVDISLTSDGRRLVRIGIPKKGSYVIPWAAGTAEDPAVGWRAIDLDEFWLPEDFFSDEFLKNLRQTLDAHAATQRKVGDSSVSP
jgi:hypothetical protein